MSGDIHDNDALMNTTVVTVTSSAETEPVPGVGATEVTGQYGTLLIASDGTYTYTINPDASVTTAQQDVFTITVSNGPTTDTSTLTFNIGPDGTPPASPDADITPDGTTLVGGVGAAEPGSIITVYSAANVILGAGSAAADGSYEVTLSPAQIDGQALTVTATDGAGNSSIAANVVAPDIAAPPIPQAAISADGAIVSGTAEAGATVTVFAPDGTTPLGSATASQAGTFSITLNSPQIDGELLTVRATDPGGISSPLNVTAPDLFTAIDNQASVELEVTPTLSANANQTVDAGSVVALSALADTLTVNLLTNNSVLTFNVAGNSTREVTLNGGGAALVSLAGLGLSGDGNFDLIVYKVEDGTITEFDRVDNWLEFDEGFLNLLFPSWDADVPVQLELDGGATYYVVLANSEGLLGLNALTDLRVSTSADLTTDYADPQSVSGSVSGNVITDVDLGGADMVPTGTDVASVNGTLLGAGDTDVAGTYGTLTIDADGSYTYTANTQFAGEFGDADVFTYTLEAPDGTTETAELVIRLDFAGPPADVIPFNTFTLEEPGLTIELPESEASALSSSEYLTASDAVGGGELVEPVHYQTVIPMPLNGLEDAHEQPL